MSHFTVVVALAATSPDKIDAALADALAPFDENKTVEPYRDYKNGRAVDYWGVAAMRKDGQLPTDREPTWAEVAAAANRRDSVDSTDPDFLHVADDGRAYTVSTYNPQSKWDWWQIGGRWTGYFVPVEGAHDDPRLLLGAPGVFGNKPLPGRVDGGPRGLLDLDALRNAKALEAGAQYDEWQALTSGLPAAQGWSHFRERSTADPKDYPIDRAREEYGAQPVVQAARASKTFAWLDCPIDMFTVSRDEYQQRAADSAVPGYAYLGLDGVWQAPGEMGWFGFSSDDADSRAAYQRHVNEQIDALDADTYLVALDCHI